jgi:hypothetical protein
VTHVIPPFRLCRRRISVALGALCTAPLSAAPDRKPPYWQSLKADEVNMRVGPGEDYGIRFVYHRRHLPVKILRIKENWRFVEDPDGVRGWMVINFLGNERTASVRGAGLPKCALGAAIRRAAVEDRSGRRGQAGRLREWLVQARYRPPCRICAAGSALGCRAAVKVEEKMRGCYTLALP